MKWAEKALPAQNPFANRTPDLTDASLRLGYECPCGGIGRRAALKMQFRKECPFESGQGHHFLEIESERNFVANAEWIGCFLLFAKTYNLAK